ncbi:hypothetical protein [Arthrobacter sp. B2a2-09]|uniref:hypothetical protein n=1 Tax=Arthrobacter sp. B2a2-09 TaxID=2952822 RepID=UPI0022CD8623|nr:hypothetical protein [Arthrobacter sp. B2a2-09]MCZ9884146.1 hypothetical protein [Arthrobacter sp. B2a2-09]
MTKFSARVAVHTDDGPTWFNPGDDVPEWAEDLVGDHCIFEDAEPAEAPACTGPSTAPEGASGDDEAGEDEPGDEDSENAEADTDRDGDDVAPPISNADTPDFTAPAPRRGRPRKS